jgi:hypothetical protein
MQLLIVNCLDLLQKSINRKFYLRLSVFICGLYSIQLFMQEVYCKSFIALTID